MKRILSISLLLIFIAGQVNLTWGTHFCGQFAVDNSVSFGKENLSCGIEEEACCDEETMDLSGPVFSSEKCCSNDYYSSDADDYFFKTDSEQKKQLQFISVYVISIHNLFHLSENKYPQAKNLSFLKSPDKQVLFQTFLL